MKIKFKQRSFNLPDEDMQRLKQVARRTRCTWAGEPSIGNMLRKIASGKLRVVR